jgi:hypothetical protein
MVGPDSTALTTFCYYVACAYLDFLSSLSSYHLPHQAKLLRPTAAAFCCALFLPFEPVL